MLKNQRHNEIMQILRKKGFVTVAELSRDLYASPSSIRRDLAQLEKQGFVKRSYGGAEAISSAAHILPFSARSIDNVDQKYIIAQKAVAFVHENDVVFLDQSSTSYFLALMLRDMKNITVVTNNIEILNLLSKSNMTVHCSGGTISRDNDTCLVGNNAQATFEGIYADVMFFSTKSVSADGVISDCSQDEIFVRNAMFKNAGKKVFLCDSKKVGTHASFVQCSLSDIDAVVSETDCFDSFRRQFPTLEIM